MPISTVFLCVLSIKRIRLLNNGKPGVNGANDANEEVQNLQNIKIEPDSGAATFYHELWSPSHKSSQTTRPMESGNRHNYWSWNIISLPKMESPSFSVWHASGMSRACKAKVWYKILGYDMGSLWYLCLSAQERYRRALDGFGSPRRGISRTINWAIVFQSKKSISMLLLMANILEPKGCRIRICNKNFLSVRRTPYAVRRTPYAVRRTPSAVRDFKVGFSKNQRCVDFTQYFHIKYFGIFKFWKRRTEYGKNVPRMTLGQSELHPTPPRLLLLYFLPLLLPPLSSTPLRSSSPSASTCSPSFATTSSPNSITSPLVLPPTPLHPILTYRLPSSTTSSSQLLPLLQRPPPLQFITTYHLHSTSSP
ncbi:unnamed protein product, partial [Nesidiocoris tenuis]